MDRRRGRGRHGGDVGRVGSVVARVFFRDTGQLLLGARVLDDEPNDRLRAVDSPACGNRGPDRRNRRDPQRAPRAIDERSASINGSRLERGPAPLEPAGTKSLASARPVAY